MSNTQDPNRPYRKDLNKYSSSDYFKKILITLKIAFKIWIDEAQFSLNDRWKIFKTIYLADKFMYNLKLLIGWFYLSEHVIQMVFLG